jgi:hypothetical protein
MTRQGMTDVIQINAKGRKYFCTTRQEQEAFAANNPNVEMEIFNIELSAAAAKKYLNDPENKKQFTVPESVRN